MDAPNPSDDDELQNKLMHENEKLKQKIEQLTKENSEVEKKLTGEIEHVRMQLISVTKTCQTARSKSKTSRKRKMSASFNEMLEESDGGATNPNKFGRVQSAGTDCEERSGPASMPIPPPSAANSAVGEAIHPPSPPPSPANSAVGETIHPPSPPLSPANSDGRPSVPANLPSPSKSINGTTPGGTPCHLSSPVWVRSSPGGTNSFSSPGGTALPPSPPSCSSSSLPPSPSLPTANSDGKGTPGTPIRVLPYPSPSTYNLPTPRDMPTSTADHKKEQIRVIETVHSWATMDPGVNDYDVDQPETRSHWLKYEFWRKNQTLKDIKDGRIRHIPTGNYNRCSVAGHRIQCEWSQHKEHIANMNEEEKTRWRQVRKSWRYYEWMRVGQNWFAGQQQVAAPMKGIYKFSPPAKGEYSRPDPTKPQAFVIYNRDFKYIPPNWSRPPVRTQSSALDSPTVRRSLSLSNSVNNPNAWESPNDGDDVNASSAAAPKPKSE